jgi:hypothetical protein
MVKALERTLTFGFPPVELARRLEGSWTGKAHE